MPQKPMFVRKPKYKAARDFSKMVAERGLGAALGAGASVPVVSYYYGRDERRRQKKRKRKLSEIVIELGENILLGSLGAGRWKRVFKGMRKGILSKWMRGKDINGDMETLLRHAQKSNVKSRSNQIVY